MNLYPLQINNSPTSPLNNKKYVRFENNGIITKARNRIYNLMLLLLRADIAVDESRTTENRT